MFDIRTRGALLGLANGVTIALLFAVFERGQPVGSLLDPPWFFGREPGALTLFLAVAMHTVPVGILGGIVFAIMAIDFDCGWLLQTLAVGSIAIVATLICCLPCPAVARYGCATAGVYSAVLVWWVSRRGAGVARDPECRAASLTTLDSPAVVSRRDASWSASCTRTRS